MDLKKVFQKMLEKIHPKKMEVAVSREARAVTHWKIIVISFLSAVLLVFIGNFFFYQNISQDDLSVVGAAGTSTATSTVVGRLDTTVNFFKNKGATFDQLRNTPVTSVDPSL